MPDRTPQTMRSVRIYTPERRGSTGVIAKTWEPLGVLRLFPGWIAPPRIKFGHVSTRPKSEVWWSLFEKRCDAFMSVGRLPHPENALGIDFVCLHGMIGAQHPPEELPRQRGRHRGGVGCHLEGECARRLHQRLRRDDATDEAAGQCIVSAAHSTCIDPLGGAVDSDDARQKPTTARLGNDAAFDEHESHPRAGGGDAHIHWKGHGDADANGRAVDGRGHRLVSFEKWEVPS